LNPEPAVEVDTETGMVTIRSYVAVDDVGKVVNPLIVEGQVQGGIAQALYEEAVYDDAGNLLTTTLADYLVPSAADVPTLQASRTECRPTTGSASSASARRARSPPPPRW
jgi:aerobic carbon-monoxide dehydrogenase large subunit